MKIATVILCLSLLVALCSNFWLCCATKGIVDFLIWVVTMLTIIIDVVLLVNVYVPGAQKRKQRRERK